MSPVFPSRRELRAAGAYRVEADVAAPVVPVNTVPPVPRPTPELEATQAFDVVAAFGLTPKTSKTPTTAGSPNSANSAVLGSGVTGAAPTRRDLRPSAQLPSAREAHRNREKRAHQDSARRTPRLSDERKSLRQRLTGVGVMVLVGGLFAVLALPAYADNNATSLTTAAQLSSQKLSVNSAAAAEVTADVKRDGYTATSATDLKKLYADAIRQRNLADYLQSGAKAQGDDYPWFAELSRNQGGGLSPLNYYYRECVDFVAWRINRDQGSTSAPFKWTWSNLTPSGGNASQWKSAWLNHGWATGSTPVVGSVAWFPYNHVAYVSGILNNGQVMIEEYNWQGQHVYGTRVINADDAYYLYAPPA
ncbi:CHAP domain-containing protein [Lysinimonas soli]|uniref:CHAP domain-containing protein n=1 Tax=Lysinimonas soli TaxID=1074233 RepID=A0ABW0NJ73_9MICO